jgi:hypothetical protein
MPLRDSILVLLTLIVFYYTLFKVHLAHSKFWYIE